MRVNVYLCKCGDNITSTIDENVIREELFGLDGVTCKSVEFLCSEEGKQALADDLVATKPERVVVAACSPRDYETVFRQVLSGAGINPYYLQMVNIREQVAWVTPDATRATSKALRLIRAAIARVEHHQPLAVREVDVNTDVVVVGSGPAGLKSALCLAEAGRHVTVVEKAPNWGGLPVRFEELFPNMECGPCLLEPVLSEAMHGRHAANIELLTLAEVTQVTGYHGNFTVKIRQRPRFVEEHSCIGCGECIPICPVSVDNESEFGLSTRRAIAFPFAGALPNTPFIDSSACLRGKAEDCDACLKACPVPDAISFTDNEKILERKAGALVIATGASLYDPSGIAEFRDAGRPGVYTNLECERILASNGPTGGEFRIPESGRVPGNVAVIHCVGSLDPKHVPYCSGVCCSAALKLSHLASAKSPETRFVHLYKELVLPGKEDFVIYDHAQHNPQITLERYLQFQNLSSNRSTGTQTLEYVRSDGTDAKLEADMVILCPAIAPSAGLSALAKMLDVPTDKFGFFEESHGRIDSSSSKLKGVYLAGGCQSPGDIQKAVNQGLAAAAGVLSELVPGRKLELDPVRASVNEALCSSCGLCHPVCPYRAIIAPSKGEPASVNEMLCRGCGTCVASCPTGAMQGAHFTDPQIFAELEALLP